MKGSLGNHFENIFCTKESVHNLIPTRTIQQTKNNEEHICTLGSGIIYIPNQKLMAIDMLNINSSLLEAEKSSSYCDGNGRHGRVADMPHLLNLHGNRLPNLRRPSAQGSRRNLCSIVTGSYIRLPKRVFFFY